MSQPQNDVTHFNLRVVPIKGSQLCTLRPLARMECGDDPNPDYELSKHLNRGDWFVIYYWSDTSNSLCLLGADYGTYGPSMPQLVRNINKRFRTFSRVSIDNYHSLLTTKHYLLKISDVNNMMKSINEEMNRTGNTRTRAEVTTAKHNLYRWYHAWELPNPYRCDAELELSIMRHRVIDLQTENARLRTQNARLEQTQLSYPSHIRNLITEDVILAEMRKQREDWECEICCNEYDDTDYKAKLTKCGHVFCAKCMTRLSRCPSCREWL